VGPAWQRVKRARAARRALRAERGWQVGPGRGRGKGDGERDGPHWAKPIGKGSGHGKEAERTGPIAELGCEERGKEGVGRLWLGFWAGLVFLFF